MSSVQDLDFVDLTTDNILEAYNFPKFLDDWNLQQLLKPLLDYGSTVQVATLRLIDAQIA